MGTSREVEEARGGAMVELEVDVPVVEVDEDLGAENEELETSGLEA